MSPLARALLSLLLAPTIVAQGKNLLFYGNSFTYYSWGYGVPELVGLIATEAGHATPTIVQALIGGSTLGDHATNPSQIAIISNSLPAGQTWDHVIMQGRAQEATTGVGFDPTVFRSNAVAITSNVRSHSPAAGAVMYQTWAMAWGHWNYPVPWAVPMEMHDELRINHRLAASDISATFGAGVGRNSAVGDAVALLEWDPMWYESDMAHPSPAMILLAAMCLYTTMYDQTVCQIAPDFSAGSPLSLALTPFALGAPDWNFLAGVADRSAAPSVRRYPGSGDHLLLESSTGLGPVTACPTNQLTAGTLLQLQMRSTSGVYDAAQAWLLVDFFATGSAPGPSLPYPEIQVDLGRMIVLVHPTPLATPMTITLSMPLTLPGGSFLVQGLAWQQSLEFGNPVFTTSDAHELIFY